MEDIFIVSFKDIENYFVFVLLLNFCLIYLYLKYICKYLYIENKNYEYIFMFLYYLLRC